MRRRNLVTTVGLLAAVAVAAVPVGGAATTMSSTPVKVTVTMTDFKFKLSTLKVPVGKAVKFTVINKGPSPHDFDVTGTKGTPVILKGKTVVQNVTFKKKGSFRFVCTVPRHAQFGMVGNLKVS